MSLVHSRLLSRMPLALAMTVGAILPGACAASSSWADKVKITHNAADVASCQSLGNIKVPRNEYGDVNTDTAERQFRSQTLSLNGNTAYVNVGPLGKSPQAAAYRCP